MNTNTQTIKVLCVEDNEDVLEVLHSTIDVEPDMGPLPAQSLGTPLHAGHAGDV